MNNIDNKTLLVGYIQAFVAVMVFLGVNQIMGRYSVVVWQVNPVLYSCSAFASCALVLLAYSGHGKLARETMRSFDTWSYGFVLMLSYITGMVLFGYVSATEATMLQKVSVLLGLLSSWFFLARKPDIFQTIGTIIVSAGVIMVVNNINSPDKGIILILSFLYGGLQITRMFIAELHRPHTKAAQQNNDPKARARVVAFVMFIMSSLFIFGSFLVAVAQSLQEDPIAGLPTLENFFHGPTIFAGMIAGILIVAPSRILEFSSSYTIKAENFAAITTLSFFSTLFWEWATSPLTGLSMKSLSNEDILAGVIITLGGLVIALSRGYVKRNKKEKISDYLYQETQNLEIVDDSRETLLNAIEHLNGDIKKVANLLELPIIVIEKMLNDETTSFAFKAKVFDNVMRNYRKNISSKDTLTGLLNRAGFIAELKSAITEKQNFALFYLDLNKFKPINDRYGHDAGDFVLQEIGKRLKADFTSDCALSRLGGDEFCIMLKINKEQIAVKSKQIINIIEQPLEYKELSLQVGTSVGISTFPEDGDNAMSLIKLADKQMYIEKEGR